MKANQEKIDCVRKAITLIDNVIKLNEKQLRTGRLNKQKLYIYVYKNNQCIDKLESVKIASDKYGVSPVRIHKSCNGDTIRSEYTFHKDI